MPRQVQVPSVGMIALGVFIAAFVLLMLAGHSFLAALLFAMIVAAAVGVFFLIANDRSKGSGDGESAAGASPTDPAPSPPKSSPAPEPASGAAPTPPPTPEPATASAPAAEAPSDDLAEPPRLNAPRGGEAGDLKRIKGIGPKIEEALHGMGIYHLDQIAAWGAAEVAWMDEHLEDFRGRVSRDDWVGQARHLADGGNGTSSRGVDEGGAHD